MVPANSMSIEKDINQSKFRNEFQKSSVNIIYTCNWMNEKIKSYLDEFELTSQQFNILRILRGQYPKPATVNLLKERMIDKMSDASRIVDRLVQKELVSRCTNTKDRRAVDVRISDKGLDILSKMDGEFKVKDILQKNLTAEEAATLSDLLDKLRG